MKNKIARKVLCLFLMLTIMIPVIVPFAATAEAPATYSDISADSTASVTISSSGSSKYFRFIPSASGTYKFYSSDNTTDTYGYFLDANGTVLTQDDDSAGSRNFGFTYACTAGTTYYIRAYIYGGGTGSYTLNVQTVELDNPPANPVVPDDPNGAVQINAASGTNYALFNSGLNTSSQKSKDGNYDASSFNNNGYDLTSNNSNVSQKRMRLGLSFYMAIDVDEVARISIYAYDIDENGNYANDTHRERDYVFLVDETTNQTYQLDGYMSGLDGKWSTTNFNIDSNLLVQGHTYHFEFETTCYCGANCGWWSYVRTVSLIVNGLSGDNPPVNPQTGIESADLSAAISAGGLVTVDLTANAYAAGNYALEYKAVCTSNRGQYGGKQYSVAISTEPNAFSTSFQLESGALRGTYEITVFIKDGNGNVITTRTATASYGYAAVSYNSNGGSQNLPSDGTTYSDGDVVTVKFDYVPSMYGFVFAGWSTDRYATEPMYTANGNNTFVIGASDVTLYAIWVAESHCEHLTHVFVAETPATCTSRGTGHYECAECGEYLSEGTEPALGHDYVIVRTDEATCTEDGRAYFECARENCGATKEQLLPAPGHNFGANNVCLNCGFERIVHNHNYTSTTHPATCTTMGYTEFVCDCGYSYRADYIEILGHLWNDGEVTVAKTCTTGGTMLYTCQRCDASYEREIPAAHEWVEYVTIPATCTTDGELVRNCTDCGASEVEIIPAAHTWVDVSVTLEPTCKEAGEKICSCEACGAVEAFVIEKLGHSFVNGVCTRCGEGFLENVVQGDHPEYGMYFEIEDIVSNYGPDVINEYGLLLDYNEGAEFKKVAIYLTQDGTMWRRCIACVGENIEYATYVPYLSYGDDIKYTGLNSDWINIFRLSENADGIWCYSNYATIGVNLEDNQGRLLLSLYDIGQAGTQTRIFDDLSEMIAWLTEDNDNECSHEAGKWITVNEPTYTSEGLRVKRCISCNAIMESEILPKLNEVVAKVETNVEYAPVNGEIVYTLTIENCTLANALALVPQFDENIFELISSEWTVEAFLQDIDTETGRAIAAWAEATDVNRVVFTFTLKAKTGCESTTVGCVLKAEINKQQIDIFVLSDDIKICDHSEVTYVMVDAHRHNVVCTCCGYVTEEAHVYDNNADGECNCCGYQGYRRGDVDNDGDVDSDDVVYLLYHTFFGDAEYPVVQNLDFDGDGSETTDDGIYLLYHIYYGELQYPLH